MSFINYTGLTYDDIKRDIKTRLSEDSRFDNFRESSLYSVITEIFAATTDFTNYYIERRAEESFLDSAKLRSSIVLLSKMLGYVITRPVPAKASIKMVISSLPADVTAGKVIIIDAGTTFTYNGIDFIIPKALTYTITQKDIINFADPTYVKEINFRASGTDEIFDDSDSRSQYGIEIVQGEKRTKKFDFSTNTQMGQRFQTYTIEDPGFSNLYGSEDKGYSSSNGSYDYTVNWTRVAVGINEGDAFATSMNNTPNEYFINRRSFLNSDTIPLLTAYGAGANVNCCVIRTTMTDGVEILFADDNVSSIGAKSGKNVYVRYLATKGAKANTIGVVGKAIQCSKSDYGSGFDKKNVSFFLTSNITGGSDIEDIESIKINSPEIFYSLDRCVTPRDYINYLKTLTLSTKKVKNAIAWGEQEETRFVEGIANIKLFNVVLFSALSDMYVKQSDSTLGTIYTNVDTDANTVIAPLTATEFDWFNTIMLSDNTTPLKNIVVSESPEMNDLKNVYEKLYERSQISVKNVYVSPIIQDFQLSGTIYFNPLINKTEAIKKIKNSVYSHLSLNADFNTPVFKSTIIDLIEGFAEVHHADVNIVPVDKSDSEYTFTVTSSGTDNDRYGDSVAYQPFRNASIGTVFSTSLTTKAKFGTREYSRLPAIDSIDIFKQILSTYNKSVGLSAFTSASYESVFCLLPNFEVISTKVDSDFIESTLIWPSSNTYDSDTCDIVTTTTKNTKAFEPSERNLYLGLMKCYLDKLNILSKGKDTFDNKIEKWDLLLNSSRCWCSLTDLKDGNSLSSETKDSSCLANLNKANASEIQYFIDNYFFYLIQILRNTFSYTIRQNMIDSNGNISKFSMRNEIARVSMENVTFTYR